MIKVTTNTDENLYFTYMLYPMLSDGYCGIACFNYNDKHNTYFFLEDIKSIEKQVSDLTISEMHMLGMHTININDDDTVQFGPAEFRVTDFINVTQHVKDCLKRAAMVFNDYDID